MVFFTTETIGGRYPSMYYGLVHGLGASTEGNFGEAVNKANTSIEQAAERNGANAIIGIRYETTSVGRNIIIIIWQPIDPPYSRRDRSMQHRVPAAMDRYMFLFREWRTTTRAEAISSGRPKDGAEKEVSFRQ